MKDSIKIGPHFFQQEKRNYSDWRTALIREIVQNAADSNSTWIKINIIPGNSIFLNGTKITIEDDGSGMSRQVLENVFLSLGETTKNSSSSVGGFGKARVLICFAQEKYTIKSFDYICTGSGAEYEIKKSPLRNRDGCLFEIETDNSNWEIITKEVLKKCSLSQTVYLNGERFSERIRQSKLIRSLSFADIYVNKSANPGVYVRSGGCWMFSKYSNIKAQVCVELHKETARDVLTANRDGLQYNQDNELQNFLNELAADTRSALADKTRHFTKFVNKGVGFKSRPKGYTPNLIKTNLLELRACNVQKEEMIKSAGGNPVDEEFLPVYQTDPILSSMIILNESNDKKKIQLIKNFYMPEKWESRAATRYQLVRIWFTICQIVMDELSNYLKQEYTFGIGFNFSDENEDNEIFAMHMESAGIHYLMFNPINKDNLLKYSVNDVDDYFNLVVLACHEASHCAFTRHDESFSSLFTILTQKVLARRKEIVNNCKEAKNN